MTTIQEIAEEIFVQLSPEAQAAAALPDDHRCTAEEAAATEEIFEHILRSGASLGNKQIRELLPAGTQLSSQIAFGLAVMDVLEAIARNRATDSNIPQLQRAILADPVTHHHLRQHLNEES